ncbi:hypothetical protein KY285_035382 [Solanum tuberosum]|nr:hypothetical protein KY285_035382 [Solanum tuberosum]
MDVYVTLRFHHGGKLQQKPRIKYDEEPQEPVVGVTFIDVGEDLGEDLGRTSTSIGEDLGEDLGRTSASVGEDLGKTSTSVGEDLDEYDSDVYEEAINLMKEKMTAKINKKDPRSEGVNLEKKKVDLKYNEYLSKKQTTLEGKIAGDKPNFDSDEAVSFEIDADEDVDEEDEVEQPIKRERKARRTKRNKKKGVFDPTCQLIVWETGLSFESVTQFREAITRYAIQEHVESDKYINEATKVMKDLEVHVERTVVRKARKDVLQQIMSDHVEEFKRILDYRDELLRTNPGSTGVTFKAGARRCIGFDGCFLKGREQPNSTTAWAVGEVENIFTWRWFIRLLRDDLELGHGLELTTIIDMQKGLDKAIQDVLQKRINTF